MTLGTTSGFCAMLAGYIVYRVTHEGRLGGARGRGGGMMTIAPPKPMGSLSSKLWGKISEEFGANANRLGQLNGRKKTGVDICSLALASILRVFAGNSALQSAAIRYSWIGCKSLFHFKEEHLRGMRVPRILEVWKLGTVNYLEALKLQEKLASDRKSLKITDTLLSLQHPPTYTLGKRRTDHNLLVPESELEAMGAELHYTQRGGDITFHGPHQAILYPIISLRDIGLGARKYVENLELTMIELASKYGVKAQAGRTGETGVWVGERKIGAIGVRISSGITSHGLAFNIDPDLSYFKNIVPCGIADKEVTSLKREANVQLPSEDVIQEELISCFIRLFGYNDIAWKNFPSLPLHT
nr:octanoyltransferase LIP2, mitochondrial-like [Ipomoea batatas]